MALLRIWLLGVVLATAPGGCGDKDEEAPAGKGGGAGEEAEQPEEPGEPGEPAAAADDLLPAEIAYPDSEVGLTQLVTDLLVALEKPDRERAAALLDSLRLPDPKAWFGDRFARDQAEKLVRAYAPVGEEIGHIEEVLASYAALEDRALEVQRIEDADDPKATGFQKKALEAARPAPVLYSVRLSHAESGAAFRLFSFVHEAGSFRFLGKLAPLGGSRRKAERELLHLTAEDAQRTRLAREIEERREKLEP